MARTLYLQYLFYFFNFFEGMPYLIYVHGMHAFELEAERAGATLYHFSSARVLST